MSPAPRRPLPGLYLATPLIDDPSALSGSLCQLLAGVEIAAVLLRLTKPAQDQRMAQIRALVKRVQDAGVAVVIDGAPDLALAAGADGAHAASLAALQEALTRLKPERICGVAGLTSRHDAMTAGEIGADYLLFGEASGDGSRPSLHALTERITWWAEIFEPPCVGFAGSAEEAGAIAAAGADFVLLGEFIWADPRGPAGAIAEARAAMASAQAGVPPLTADTEG